LGQWAKSFGTLVEGEDRKPTGLGAVSGAPRVPSVAAISTARQLESFLREEEEIYFKGNGGVYSNCVMVLSEGESELEGGLWTGMNIQGILWIVSVEEVVNGIFSGLISGGSK
jgi:hypothetical protein